MCWHGNNATQIIILQAGTAPPLRLPTHLPARPCRPCSASHPKPCQGSPPWAAPAAPGCRPLAATPAPARCRWPAAPPRTASRQPAGPHHIWRCPGQSLQCPAHAAPACTVSVPAAAAAAVAAAARVSATASTRVLATSTPLQSFSGVQMPTSQALLDRGLPGGCFQDCDAAGCSLHRQQSASTKDGVWPGMHSHPLLRGIYY
jgi:hypothetical protein